MRNNIIFALIILFSGCSSGLVLHESKWEKERDNSAFTGYDKTSKMNWQVSNDDENLYIRITTANRPTIMKMMRKGFKVYFNIVDDKKKSLTYLNYPIEAKKQASEERPNMTGMGGMRGGGRERGAGNMQGGRRREFDVQKFLKRLPKNVIYQKNGQQYSFNYALEKSDIKINLQGTNDGKLYYEAVVPFERIIDGGLKNIRNLAVGLESGSFDMPVMSTRGPGGMGGRPAGMQGGMRPNMSELADPVKVWFKVKTAKQ